MDENNFRNENSTQNAAQNSDNVLRGQNKQNTPFIPKTIEEYEKYMEKSRKEAIRLAQLNNNDGSPNCDNIVEHGFNAQNDSPLNNSEQPLQNASENLSGNTNPTENQPQRNYSHQNQAAPEQNGNVEKRPYDFLGENKIGETPPHCNTQHNADFTSQGQQNFTYEQGQQAGYANYNANQGSAQNQTPFYKSQPQNIYGGTQWNYSNQQNPSQGYNQNVGGNGMPYSQPPVYGQYGNGNMPYNQGRGGQMPPLSDGFYNYLYQQPGNKKKMNKGAKIFIICIVSLLGLSLITAGIYFVSISNNRNNFSNISGATYPNNWSNEEEQTTPENDTTQPAQNNNSAIAATDPDYKGVTLEKPPADSASGKYTTQNAYDKVSKSVVGVMCYTNGIPADDDTDTTPEAEGTGIIVTNDGYIVTNSHVINNSTSYYVQIITNDGKKYTAGIVGYDSRTDLAVLKINGNNLTAAAFANSSDIVVGQDVVAIGNPGGIGFQNSLTKGIVSAVNRTFSTSSTVKYIQTDAAINPGNSGGPLCNLYGQVIGINTSKIVSTQYEGMGFSIPSNTVKEIIDDIIKQGYVGNRVRIGITGVAVTAEDKQNYNVPYGILVDSIDTNGPLNGTDVKKGDIITAVDGKQIKSFQDIYEILNTHSAGDKVTLSVCRLDSKDASKDQIFTVEITLVADTGSNQ